MVFALLVTLLVYLPIAVLGTQVPLIDAVVGGVPINKPLTLETATSSSATVAGSLRVTENSGICETTKGVYQASGYGDLDANSHMWFWFFEARNNPDKAPLAVWLNGGPGSSSMIGVFQEHGPCFIRNDSSGVDFNPSSWNEAANILYIDQPVGVGFSYGSATVGSARDAAKAVWNFLQIFFADSRFNKYAAHEFALWTESYGGRYGPVFVSHFLDQNEAISAGTVEGLPINLKVLGIGNGLTDPISQYPGYISYAKNNPYHQLVSDDLITGVNNSYYSPGGCRDLIIACNKDLNNTICSEGQKTCNDVILVPLSGNWDMDYVPVSKPHSYPSDSTTYINSVKTSIGAETTWTDFSETVYTNFASTGDWIKSSAAELERVINAGVRTVIYVGDADYLCNYMGVEAMIANLNTSLSSTYAGQPWTKWTVNGTTVGQYKNAGTLSYIRVFQAGHEVPAYTVGDLPRGLHALTMFEQANALLPIYST